MLYNGENGKTNPQQVVDAAMMKVVECHCGSRAFESRAYVTIMQHRLDPKRVAFTEIRECACKGCGKLVAQNAENGMFSFVDPSESTVR